MTDPALDDRDVLEERLHGLDAELEKLRKRLYWLRATLGPDQEDHPDVQSVMQRYDEVAEEFTKVYREWNRRG